MSNRLDLQSAVVVPGQRADEPQSAPAGESAAQR